jgi:hypothetical protein
MANAAAAKTAGRDRKWEGQPLVNDPVVAAPRVQATRVVHTIHAVVDVDAAQEVYVRAFGGKPFAGGYHEGEDRDMSLLYVADHMVEPMAPRRPEATDKTFARYLARYGSCFHSIELKTPDCRKAAADCKAMGLELTTEYDIFFFIHPRSTGGLVIEVTDVLMGADPYDQPDWDPDWAKGGPSQIKGLAYVACVVRDLGAAVRCLTEAFDGEVISRDQADWPQPCTRVFVSIGGTVVALLSPKADGQGPLSNYLAGLTSGIYALAWAVEDLDKASGWFASQGLSMTPDVPAAARAAEGVFMGARHWFVGGDAFYGWRETE